MFSDSLVHPLPAAHGHLRRGLGHNRAEHPRVPYRPARTRARTPFSLPPSTRSSSPPGSCPRSWPPSAGTPISTRAGRWTASCNHIGLSQDWLYTTPMLAIIIANVWRGHRLFHARVLGRPFRCAHRPARGGPGRRRQPGVHVAPGHHPPAPAFDSHQPDAHNPPDPGQFHPDIRADGGWAGGGEPDDAPVHLPAGSPAVRHQLRDGHVHRPSPDRCPVLCRLHKAHQGGGSR